MGGEGDEGLHVIVTGSCPIGCAEGMGGAFLCRLSPNLKETQKALGRPP